MWAMHIDLTGSERQIQAKEPVQSNAWARTAQWTEACLDVFLLSADPPCLKDEIRHQSCTMIRWKATGLMFYIKVWYQNSVRLLSPAPVKDYSYILFLLYLHVASYFPTLTVRQWQHCRSSVPSFAFFKTVIFVLFKYIYQKKKSFPKTVGHCSVLRNKQW